MARIANVEEVKSLDWIRREMSKGNAWAWCKIKVWAVWKDFRGDTFLNCCSFATKADFLKSEHFERMKALAYDDLCHELDKTFHKLEELLL